MTNTYKVRLKYIANNALILIFPLVLTVITMAEGDAAEAHEWAGVRWLWIITGLLTLAPLPFRLEVSTDTVKTYILFGICTRELRRDTIDAIEYGNLFRGGLGYGKGLKGWERRAGGLKYFSIGERAYGKEAIEHAARALGGTTES